jgi:ABC-type Fe3+/spermidine/putrescine transport system ATPase subunit
MLIIFAKVGQIILINFTTMHLLEVSQLFSEILLGGFALEDICFTQAKGERIAVIGATGNGKSTLLKTIAGLIQHQSGTILFDGKIAKGPNHQLVAGEKGIAYLSQHFELRNNYRMEELLSYSNELTKVEANTIFELCEISHLLKRNSKQLSGGEKQRIAFARLLISRPKLLILDEPFSNLDFAHKEELKNLLYRTCEELGITCLMSSHDSNDILPWADKIIVLQEGKIIQQGTAEEIYYQPINDYVAALCGKYNIISIGLAGILEFNFQGAGRNGFQNDFRNDFPILRPSQLVINPSAEELGEVVSCKFMGTHFEVEVEIKACSVFVQHNELLAVGARVGLRLT